VNHTQPGDPAKLGLALVELASADARPVHFAVGADADADITNRHRGVLADIATWRALSEGRATTNRPAPRTDRSAGGNVLSRRA
jgi:hypothetical protein